MSAARYLWPASGWLLMVALGVGLLIAPSARKRMAIAAETRNLEQELSKPTDGPEVIERLTRDLSRLRALGEGRMTPIPASSDVAGLMQSLSGTLGELGLEKREVTTRPPKSFDDAMSMPVTIALSGPFPKVYEAVRSIEFLPRLVRVERLMVRHDAPPGEEISRDAVVRAELSIDAFFSPERAPDAEAKTGAAP